MANRTRISRPPRILIASDQDGGLWELQALLDAHGYLVERVYASTPVPERARAIRPVLIILDASFPDRESLALSRALRDDPEIGPSTPILLLMTGRPTSGDHVAALRAGIWELLTRPLNRDEVLAKVNAYWRAAAEAEPVRTKELVDSVTGLYTSQGLARRARDLLLQASQHNTSAACVVFAPEIGVDPTASGADAPSSGELVRRAGEIFMASGRRSDAIGRIGHAEIAVFAAGTDGRGALQLAERFRYASHAGRAGQADASPRFELRAGYHAVPSVRYTPIEPLRLLGRATRALQLARTEGKWVREASEGP
ncbi:MAG TPA: response regulator [Gemmatimonadales bacterium]|nr:response regulator [Gemmatimonadales bacterium]